MLSKAYTHYPQYRFTEAGKVLWNPVLRKSFKDLPEERVRLQLLDYLLLEAGHSSARISFESPVQLSAERNKSRTDLIAYTSDFKPKLLAECKAPDIRLNEKTSLQIARYNREIDAPYLMVTNGMMDFWFSRSADQVIQLKEVPEAFAEQESGKQRSPDIKYWQERAFIGRSEFEEPAGEWLMNSCRDVYLNPLKAIKYLRFDGSDPELSLSHYYRVVHEEGHPGIAIAFSATPSGSTRLNLILNENGQNTAFLSSELNRRAKGGKDSVIQSAAGTVELSLEEEAGLNFSTPLMHLLPVLRNLLRSHS